MCNGQVSVSLIFIRTGTLQPENATNFTDKFGGVMGSNRVPTFRAEQITAEVALGYGQVRARLGVTKNGPK